MRRAHSKIWDSLSDSDKAKCRKRANRGFVLMLCLSMAATLYVISHLWHWPFWLAVTVGPVVGGALGLALIVAPIWAIATWASSARCSAPHANGNNPGK